MLALFLPATLIHATVATAAEWLTPVLIDGSETKRSDPAVAMGDDGYALLGFTAEGPRVKIAVREPGETFSRAKPLGSKGGSSLRLGVVAGERRGVAAWFQGREVRVRMHSTSSGFAKPQSFRTRHSDHLTLDMAPDGSAAVAWQARRHEQLLISTRRPGKRFGRPRRIDLPVESLCGDVYAARRGGVVITCRNNEIDCKAAKPLGKRSVGGYALIREPGAARFQRRRVPGLDACSYIANAVMGDNGRVVVIGLNDYQDPGAVLASARGKRGGFAKAKAIAKGYVARGAIDIDARGDVTAALSYEPFDGSADSSVYAARLSGHDWSEPRLLGPGILGDLDVAPSGATVIRATPISPRETLAYFAPPGGTLGGAERISGSATDVHVAVDDAGQAIAAWGSGRGVLVSNRR